MAAIEDDANAFYVYGDVLSSGLFRRYILGHISRRDANLELRRKALNLKAIHHWYFEQADAVNPVTDGMREMKLAWEKIFLRRDKPLASAKDVFESLEKLKGDVSRLSNSDNQLVVKAGRQLKKAVAGQISEVQDYLYQPIDFSAVIFLSKTGVESVNQQYQTSATALVNAIATRKIPFEQSAIGDLVHSLYLPFCDLWRGDRRFVHILRSAGVPHAEKIVPRLSDLPMRIEMMLNGS